MSTRIPPLLEPYVSLPPEASLILLTSVLGASSNWLVLRFLHGALVGQNASLEPSPEDDVKVLLVSFMRDLAFWKENGKRLGIDFDKLAAKKRFSFVDGLSGLFLPKQQNLLSGRTGEKTLCKPDLATVTQDIQQAVEGLNGGKGGSNKVLLVIDHVDLLLAAGGDQVTVNGVGEMLMGLREHVHATVITLSADYPLAAAHLTPLETDHATLLLSLAHQADFIMSLRLLDSGTARDVSGVVRITVGEQANHAQQDMQKRTEERDLLYFVGGDGGVRVFERGQ